MDGVADDIGGTLLALGPLGHGLIVSSLMAGATVSDTLGYFLFGAFIALFVYGAIHDDEWGVGGRGGWTYFTIRRSDFPRLFWFGICVAAAGSGYCLLRAASLAIQQFKL